MKPEILCFGATGNQGGAVARRLLAHGFRVRAFVRDLESSAAQALAAQGATLVQGDLADNGALEQAVSGVYGVFLVLPFFTEGWDLEVKMGVDIIEAAKAAGVEHFVYSSGSRANLMTGVPHLESKARIEKHLIMSGLPHTIFRPVAFNYSLEGYRDAAITGILSDARRSNSDVYQLDEDDYGTFVALAFSDPTTWLGRHLDVASDVLTVQEMAALFGRILGREVTHQQISWEEETRTVGEEVVRLMHWVEAEGPRINVTNMRKAYPWLNNLESYLRIHGWETAPA